MTSPPTAALPIPPARPPVLRAVDPLPPSDFLSRAVDAGLSVDRPLEHGPLVVDLVGYSVRMGDTELDLSPRQIELLAVFLSAPKTVWSRDRLHWLCWGDTSPSRRVDVQLCRLRGRTGLDLFRNVRHRGWVLRPVA